MAQVALAFSRIGESGLLKLLARSKFEQKLGEQLPLRTRHPNDLLGVVAERIVAIREDLASRHHGRDEPTNDSHCG